MTRKPLLSYSYTRLHAAPIRTTMERLALRIAERFPGSGLQRVAQELSQLAAATEGSVERLRTPIWSLRLGAALVITAVIALACWIGFEVFAIAAAGLGGVADVLQSIEAIIDELIFLSLAVFF